MKFNVGDKVMAKWPGSALYFHANITKIDYDEGVAEVLYEDGTDMEVLIQHLANENVFTKRRTKSPARRRSRSRSPSRSPGRGAGRRKVAVEKKKENSDKSVTSSASSSDDIKAKVLSSPARSIVQRSQKYEEKKEFKEGVEKITTRSYKAEVVLQKISSNDMPTKVQKTPMKTVRFESNTTTSPKKYEFGGPIGVFFMYLTIPLMPIIMISACESNSCDLLKFKLSQIPRKLNAYYDEKSALIIAGYLLFHAIIYALPFGYIADGPDTPTGRKTKYRISAAYTLFFTIVTYLALWYYKYPMTIIYDKMFPMMTMCIALSYILNILTHWKSYWADESELNPTANTRCTIYDMYFGRELHPTFGKYFQIKLYIYRPAMCAWILINLVYLQKELEINRTIRPSVALYAGTQIFYCICAFFMDELQAVYSFDIKYEGAGFMSWFGNFVMVPFLYTYSGRYLIEHPKATIATPVLATVVALTVVGLALVLLSGYQKLKFRMNPYDPKLSGLESIPPSKKGGDRLLVSGYWGFVRHPNYLGEIFLGLAFGLVCGFNDISPWVYVGFVTILLCHRSLRDDARCENRHGYAWKEYCKRVPYRVIPYIF